MLDVRQFIVPVSRFPSVATHDEMEQHTRAHAEAQARELDRLEKRVLARLCLTEHPARDRLIQLAWQMVPGGREDQEVLADAHRLQMFCWAAIDLESLLYQPAPTREATATEQALEQQLVKQTAYGAHLQNVVHCLHALLVHTFEYTEPKHRAALAGQYVRVDTLTLSLAQVLGLDRDTGAPADGSEQYASPELLFHPQEPR